MPNDAYFQGNPTRLDTSRCSFSRSPRWTGTWNAGVLVPIFAYSSVMPGDTLSMDVSSAIRMATPQFPVMDDMDITIEAFFVPNRLTLSRKSMSPDVNDSNHSWAAILGAQDSLLNMPTPGSATLPKCGINPSQYLVGGLADCLGYPTAQGGSFQNYYVNCLKILAYYSVWNEFFREPNTRNPVTYSIDVNGNINLVGGDADVPTGIYQWVSNIPLAPVSRYHGYFGSALPWPQRNSSSIVMPLGNSAVVKTSTSNLISGTNTEPLHFLNSAAGTAFATNAELGVASTGQLSGYSDSSTPSFLTGTLLTPANLYADLSTATAATVNQFRLAVQTQRWYEQLARGGNKLSDLISSMFGVQGTSVSDRPEYLGGFTAPINISQVAQTAPVSGNGEVGRTGAFSLSNPGGFLFKKSFTEHGTIVVVACCRVKDSFCQGVDREDFRSDRFDFYWPQFANLGEQEIRRAEVYITGVASNDNTIFGYQEAWAEYRMHNDKVTGYARPTLSTGSIIGLTYCNNFSAAPDLKGFLNASKQKDNVDNTLYVQSSTSGYQFYGQFQFNLNWVRPMPLYSIPGLVDHH